MTFSAASTNTEEVPTMSGAYETLAYNIFPPSRSGASNSVAIAFTSANSGEGVTHVVGSVLRAMHGSSSGSFHIDMDWLKSQPADRSLRGVEDSEERSEWTSGWEHRRYLIKQLRLRFQYLAIDCPALGTSSDVLGLAPLVDGIVLVVEADRTRKSQIRNAERQIEAAGGKLLGLVLNKRRYPVPDYIYDLL
jgi:hypothetical protein